MQAPTIYTRGNTGASEVSFTFWDLWLHKYILSEPKASEFPSGDIVSTFGLLCKKRAQPKMKYRSLKNICGETLSWKVGEIINLFVS